LEDDQDFQDKVLSVYHATLVAFDMVPCIKIIENHHGKGTYVTVQTQIFPQQAMPIQ
jgi:hypothetical protein